MIEVGNIRDYIVDGKAVLAPHAAYIGRAVKRYGLKASPLENPYSLRWVTRAVAVTLFRQWLRHRVPDRAPDCYTPRIIDKEQAKLMVDEMARLRALHEKHGRLLLLCWCAPKPCHGDVIKQVLEQST